ncbi:hypothetical protein BVC80_857g28 [Macleaya cordata]|uniref:Uncharacterized protein n=1 Tax=Macleaya cordata TaxID=56857 RepID=A0A200Q6R1_MACCD|nr:hypothetical protein BVC80_857g28 [Macleaya cordata]
MEVGRWWWWWWWKGGRRDSNFINRGYLISYPNYLSPFKGEGDSREEKELPARFIGIRFGGSALVQDGTIEARSAILLGSSLIDTWWPHPSQVDLKIRRLFNKVEACLSLNSLNDIPKFIFKCDYV